MRNLLLLFALIVSFAASSQELTLEQPTSKEIKYERGKFYLNDIQIPSYQVKKLFASDVRALSLFKKAKAKEGLGGMLLGLGITLSAVDLAIGLFSDVSYPTALTYVGLGAVAVSIPVLSGRAKKVKAAVTSYNDGLKSSSSVEDYYELNALANQQGIGIQIKF